MFLQVLINGILAGLLFALVSLGFNLIYNSTKVFHIAHGGLYTAAAYTFLLWQSILATSLDGTMLTLVAVALSVGTASLLAALFEVGVYRPLFVRDSPPLVTFVSSLGLYIIIVNLIAVYFGNITKILDPSIEPTTTIAGVLVTRIQIIQALTSGVLIGLTFIFLKKTSLGRNVRALSDNPLLTNVLGINIKRVRWVVFMYGTALAAFASLLKALDIGVSPNVGLQAVLIAAVAVIIGGVRSQSGAVVAAILLGVLQNIVVWFYSARWQDAATFLIFIIILIVRRQGLFAARLRVEEA